RAGRRQAPGGWGRQSRGRRGTRRRGARLAIVPVGGGEAMASHLELVRETQLGLRAAVVEAAEAPGVEDGRAAAPRRDEVPLRDVHDEVVAHHVIDRPEGLHAELVGRVDGHAEHGDDAAAAVEGERGEGEERLPVPDLVPGGGAPHRPGAYRGGTTEATDHAYGGRIVA